MNKIKGIAWDHPRGYQPLIATSEAFQSLHPDMKIEWDIRSLKEFGDTPVESLVEKYDLITIDHPFMGEAYDKKLLVDLTDLLSKEVIEKLEKESVGPSFYSYLFNKQLLAVPIDAAALVSASRIDLLETAHLRQPKTREELLQFYKKIPGDKKIAWPLCPTDLWCSFLTLSAQDGGRNIIDESGIDIETGVKVLDELKVHLDYLDERSLHWNPIQVLDEMSTNDEILYAPYLFGYTNYSRHGFSKHLIEFGNSPVNPMNSISTILGGVGLAISTRCKYKREVAAYLAYVSESAIQKELYFDSGGQPGNRLAWEDNALNIASHGFFNNTKKTMEEVYVRPRHKGWNEFQERGASLLHQRIVDGVSSKRSISELNSLYESIRNEH